MGSKRSASTSPRGAKRQKREADLSPQPITIPTSSPRKEEGLKVPRRNVEYVKTPVSDGQDGYFFMAPEEYTNFTYLAKGAFGVVVTADHNDERVVIKKVHCKSLVYAESALRELHNLSYFTMRRSNGIVRLRDCWLCEDEYLYMVLEKFDKSLDNTVGKEKRLKAAQWRRVAGMLVAALNNIHTTGAMHRDLKPDNVVISEDCSRLALIDLGTVRANEHKRQRRPLTPVNEVTTEGYRAPETVKSGKYCEQIDMFSAGCLLAQIKLGYELFPSDSDLVEYRGMSDEAAHRFLKRKMKNFSKADVSFLMSLLERNPTERATSADLIRKIMTPEDEQLLHRNASDSDASDTESVTTIPTPPLYGEPEYCENSFDNMLLRIKRLVENFKDAKGI